MSIKPILFNTDMVLAIMDGRKTVTRRLIKPQPDERHTYPLGYVNDSTERKNIGCYGFGIDEFGGSIQYAKPPYQPGDILYVRETWKYIDFAGENNGYVYKASENGETWETESENWKWHPSIHMPKEAARIWLKVKDVRVERLQECGTGWCLDIEKEGVVTPQSPILYTSDDRYHDALRESFQKLWDSTIKKSDIDRYGWDANPWVWVIEFERCEKPEKKPRHIDN